MTTQRNGAFGSLRLDEMREFIPALAALVLGTALTLLVGLALAHYEHARWTLAYEERVGRWERELRQALSAYERMGRLTAALAANAPALDETTFQGYTAIMLWHGPPVAAIGWHPAMPRRDAGTVDTRMGPQPVTEAGGDGVTQALFPLRLAAPMGRYRYGYSPTGGDDPRAGAR